MRRVKTENLAPGMVVARTVYGAEGQHLLKAGTCIRNNYIAHLKRLGILSLYIEDVRLEGVVIDDVVSDETRIEAYSLVRELMISPAGNSNGYGSRLCALGKEFDDCVHKIIDEILYHEDTMMNLDDLKTANNYTFSHSVNVCVLSLVTAKKMEYSEIKMKHVGLGSLLHDLGKVNIPESILNKKGNLTEEEFELVKQHPEDGMEIFKNNAMFSSLSGDIILQHHERCDGKGYPLQLKKDEITEAAQIVSVADVFDALTSNRPYRSAYQPHQVVEMFSAADGTHHDVNIVRSLVSVVAAYPVGTLVWLSNNDCGLVIGNTPGHPLRPKIRVLYHFEDNRLSPHSDPYEVDLTEKLSLVITDVLEDN